MEEGREERGHRKKINRQIEEFSSTPTEKMSLSMMSKLLKARFFDFTTGSPEYIHDEQSVCLRCRRIIMKYSFEHLDIWK